MEVTDRGLPFVLFVCMADKLVACSGDLWGGFREFNRASRTRRKARFARPDWSNVLQDKGIQAKNRFVFVTKWLDGRDVNFGRRANERNLPMKKYNELVESMYEAGGDGGPWPPHTPGTPGGVPLDSKYGFNHTAESGRSFYGKGADLFTPISRCWKCRFVFYYKLFRPGVAQEALDGVTAEDPR
jgi:hypothetical protein